MNDKFNTTVTPSGKKDQAAGLMRAFFERIVPEGPGCHYAMYVNSRTGDRCLVKAAGRAELADLCAECDELGYDAYYTPALYGAEGGRRCRNVAALRALWMDVDCDSQSEYGSAGDALTALGEFTESLKLPTPTVVCTGIGIQVYFLLSEDVDRLHWLRLSGLLRRAAEIKDFHCDGRITTDAAAFLQPVGTMHRWARGAAVRPVSLFLDGKAVSPAGLETALAQCEGSETCGFPETEENGERQFAEMVKHYTDAVRRAGSLPAFSSDRSKP